MKKLLLQPHFLSLLITFMFVSTTLLAQDELNNCQEKLKACQEELESFKNQTGITLIEEQNKRLRNDFTQLEAFLAAERRKRKNAEREAKHYKNKYYKTLDTLKKKRRAYTDLENELKILEALRDTIRNLQTQLALTNAENTRLQSIIVELNNKIRRKEDRIDGFREDIDNAEDFAEGLKKQVANLEASFADIIDVREKVVVFCGDSIKFGDDIGSLFVKGDAATNLETTVEIK